MTETTNQDREKERDEETLARLLRLAGPRAPVPADVEARVYERVKREWQAGTAQPDSARVYNQVRRSWERKKAARSLGRWAVPVALAASILVAITVLRQPTTTEPRPTAIGTVARVVGADLGGPLPTTGAAVLVGDRLSTAGGQGLGVTLGSVGSIRLDENTVLEVASAHEFHLVRGRIYADTGNLMYREQSLEINTLFGKVTDVGTQFAVDLVDDGLDVAVREGRVDVNSESETFVTVAGQRMRLRQDDGANFDTLDPYDRYWDWVVALAPVFNIENRTLLDFLRWAARETGRELEFESNDLRMTAMRTDLHGSIAGFDPLEAVESVLVTTNFHYRLEPGRIVVIR